MASFAGPAIVDGRSGPNETPERLVVQVVIGRATNEPIESAGSRRDTRVGQIDINVVVDRCLDGFSQPWPPEGPNCRKYLIDAGIHISTVPANVKIRTPTVSGVRTTLKTPPRAKTAKMERTTLAQR